MARDRTVGAAQRTRWSLLRLFVTLLLCVIGVARPAVGHREQPTRELARRTPPRASTQGDRREHGTVGARARPATPDGELATLPTHRLRAAEAAAVLLATSAPIGTTAATATQRWAPARGPPTATPLPI